MQRMTSEKMLTQREQVRALGARLQAGSGGGALTLLHGTELNIAPDGTVDWPDEFLAGFDVCVASVHSHFDQRSCKPGVDLRNSTWSRVL
jgi:DNA polymerase (family X)